MKQENNEIKTVREDIQCVSYEVSLTLASIRGGGVNFRVIVKVPSNFDPTLKLSLLLLHTKGRTKSRDTFGSI